MVKGIVSFLQSREEFGAMFVDDNYGPVPGTFKMSTVNLEIAGRNPDIIVSYNYNENATVQGMKGTEYESMRIYRGMHGSFSPVDVHNTLIASGPDFKSGFQDQCPFRQHRRGAHDRLPARPESPEYRRQSAV